MSKNSDTRTSEKPTGNILKGNSGSNQPEKTEADNPLKLTKRKVLKMISACFREKNVEKPKCRKIERKRLQSFANTFIENNF